MFDKALYEMLNRLSDEMVDLLFGYYEELSKKAFLEFGKEQIEAQIIAQGYANEVIDGKNDMTRKAQVEGLLVENASEDGGPYSVILRELTEQKKRVRLAKQKYMHAREAVINARICAGRTA